MWGRGAAWFPSLESPNQSSNLSTPHPAILPSPLSLLLALELLLRGPSPEAWPPPHILPARAKANSLGPWPHPYICLRGLQKAKDLTASPAAIPLTPCQSLLHPLPLPRAWYWLWNNLELQSSLLCSGWSISPTGPQFPRLYNGDKDLHHRFAMRIKVKSDRMLPACSWLLGPSIY